MRALSIVGFILIAAVAAVHGQQDSLTAAKDLYVSAAYEEALTALTGIDQATPEIARAVAQYRASCLYALGRKDEAENVAEELIKREPLMQLDDAAPGIEAMFRDVRKRLLPGVIRAEYRTARAAIDEKNPARARPHLVEARGMINEAQKIGLKDEGLADLAMLVDGFLDLVSAGTAAPQVEPAPPASAATALSPGVAVQTKAPLPRESQAAKAFYGPEDEGVVPPFTVSQQVPEVPWDLMRMSAPRGVLDVLIDEKGAVVKTTLRQSINPAYDALLMRSSRSWRYAPATKGGVPVSFQKTIIVTVSR
jgi:hypothetical protein